jgi:hypothetical protein
MHRSVKLTLIENSTAGKPPKTFNDQSCDIEHEPTIYETSADGIKSHARQPTTIVWHEGKAEWFGRNAATGLMAVTNVRIVASDGKVLIDDWELITNPGVPHNVDRGVEFFVLRPEHNL